MFARVVRVLFGFALASLAAAATLVLFVYAPAEWAGLRADLSGERLTEAGFFALVVTPHIAVYAALPALAGVILAEHRKIARWTFYALAGVATAAAGFIALHLNQAPDQATILHSYVLAAFLTSGLVGGLAYWAVSGRFAARRAGVPTAPDVKPQPGPEPGASAPGTVSG